MSSSTAVPAVSSSSTDAPCIHVVSVKKSRKENGLADVAIQITFGTEQITVADFRVLRNRQGAVWVAAPTFAVTVGKSYEYHPMIVLGQALKRAVEDEILCAFESWERSTSSEVRS